MDRATLFFFILSIVKSVAVIAIAFGLLTAERWVRGRLAIKGGALEGGGGLFGNVLAVLHPPRNHLNARLVPFAEAAPWLAIVAWLMALALIPWASVAPVELVWGGNAVQVSSLGVVSPLPMGVLWVLALGLLATCGSFMATWAAYSHYPSPSFLTTACQLLAYQLPRILAVLPIAVVTGSWSLTEVVDYQAAHGWLLLPWLHGVDVAAPERVLMTLCCGMSAMLLLVSNSCEQHGLDAGAEAPFHQLLMAITRRLATWVTCALVVTLVLGGWTLPWAGSNSLQGEKMLSPMIVALQLFTFLVKLVVVRWLWAAGEQRWLDRVAELDSAGLWKWLLPVALVNALLCLHLS